ncbi:AcrR family transcriptional regulator [Kitasatospora sp. MAA4]|uniref:TetR/AcrR family transcriptional regulator n=1 Tax=Kitasatospora sp. MAA4 TaxID=3035093 RepID=UPI0024730583|nr:TetR/AcrR family transcriptional regulator [Kitasatospora sp. MAA4]MDH6130910.1 AcrR family transcriptional regulator [Kitasatospora sp. MAA4]
MVRGRPRGFDRATALRQATMLFWQYGYEGVSVAELTRLMGISTPSLYAAFGDKRTLFNEVVENYGRTFGGFVATALEQEPTARDAFARVLHEAAVIYTDHEHPAGCLVITATTNVTPKDVDVADMLRDLRRSNLALFRARIETDVAAGLLPAGTDAHALAVFYAAVIQGMSQQARDGASTSDLESTAELALAAWP